MDIIRTRPPFMLNGMLKTDGSRSKISSTEMDQPTLPQISDRPQITTTYPPPPNDLATFCLVARRDVVC